MSYAVYRLIDPRTQSTFYVGVTDNLAARYIQHLRCSDKNTRKNARIQEIKDAHFLPIPDTLEIIEEKVLALKRERYWILHYRYLGEDLLNAAFPVDDIKPAMEDEEVPVEVVTNEPIIEKRRVKIDTTPVGMEELAKRRKPLTIPQVAGILGRTERRVRDLCNEGWLERDEQNRKLVKASSVRVYLTRRRVKVSYAGEIGKRRSGND